MRPFKLLVKDEFEVEGHLYVFKQLRLKGQSEFEEVSFWELEHTKINSWLTHQLQSDVQSY